jgi:hypothetical protein
MARGPRPATALATAWACDRCRPCSAPSGDRAAIAGTYGLDQRHAAPDARRADPEAIRDRAKRAPPDGACVLRLGCNRDRAHRSGQESPCGAARGSTGWRLLIGAPIVMVLLATAGVDLVLTRNAIGIFPIGLLAVAVGFERLLGDDAATGDRPARRCRSWWGPSLLRASIPTLPASGRIGAPPAVRSRRITPLNSSSLQPASTELPLGVYVPLRRLGGHRRVRVRQIDVLQFLLTTQGGRARQALAQVPHGFRAQGEASWPDLHLTRYVATRPRVVSSHTPGAASFLLPGR